MTLSIDKKSKKSEYIYVSLLFNKLEPASGSSWGLGGAQGYRPPSTTRLNKHEEHQFCGVNRPISLNKCLNNLQLKLFAL